MFYAHLADLIVAIHVAYVGFIVVGQLAILLGLVLRWHWVRNVWFRGLHLAAILLVAVEEMGRIQCPLTTWEYQLRALGGQAVGEDSFMARLMHSLIVHDWPSWIFPVVHISFAVIVLATFVLAPPLLARRKPV